MRRGVRSPRDPEVREHHVPVALILHMKQEVARLDIPMHDAAFMNVLEGRGDLLEKVQRKGQSHGQRKHMRPLPSQRIHQRAVGHIRHDEVEQIALSARVMNWEDVWVREVAEQFPFAHEPLFNG